MLLMRRSCKHILILVCFSLCSHAAAHRTLFNRNPINLAVPDESSETIIRGSRNSSTAPLEPGSSVGLMKLIREIGVDMVAASTAALSISPIIAIFDRSILLSACNGNTLRSALSSSLRDLRRPVSFFRMKEVWWVYGLYASTYIVANVIGTMSEAMEVDGTAPKLIGTTAVNLPASIAKDQALARIVGASSVSTNAIATTSLIAYGLFAVRDIVSIAACFTLPEKVSKKLKEAFDWSSGIAEGTSQLIVPSAMQIVTTPIHLAGIDLFNRPTANPFMRFEMISKLYTSSLLLRFARTGLAFGVGGVVNKNVRNALRGHTPE